MSATPFFSKYCGADNSVRVEVTEEKRPDARVVLLDLEAGRDRVALTPEQAQKLGRALIKAGKYSAKMAKPLVLDGFTARSSGKVGGDNEHALGGGR